MQPMITKLKIFWRWFGVVLTLILKDVSRWLASIPLILLKLMTLAASFALLLLCAFYFSRLVNPAVPQIKDLFCNVQALFSTPNDTSIQNSAIGTISTKQMTNLTSETSSTDVVAGSKIAQSAAVDATNIPLKNTTPPDNNQTPTYEVSISALSMVLTAITLMLSLGTTWFANRQKELTIALQELEDKNQREYMRLNVVELRLIAHIELLRHFAGEHGSNAAASTIVIKLMPYLELLASPDTRHRQEAQQELSSAIGRGLGPKLPKTWRYSIELECYLLTYKIAKRGETYCNLFD